MRRPLHPNPTLPTRGRRLSRIRLEFDGVNEVTANEALRLVGGDHSGRDLRRLVRLVRASTHPTRSPCRKRWGLSSFAPEPPTPPLPTRGRVPRCTRSPCWRAPPLVGGDGGGGPAGSGSSRRRKRGHQRHVAGGRGRLHVRARKIGIDVEVKLRRSFLDPTEQQVLDRIEAHRTQTQGILDRSVQVIEAKGLKQASGPGHIRAVPSSTCAPPSGGAGLRTRAAGPIAAFAIGLGPVAPSMAHSKALILRSIRGR